MKRWVVPCAASGNGNCPNKFNDWIVVIVSCFRYCSTSPWTSWTTPPVDISHIGMPVSNSAANFLTNTKTQEPTLASRSLYHHHRRRRHRRRRRRRRFVVNQSVAAHRPAIVFVFLLFGTDPPARLAHLPFGLAGRQIWKPN